MTEDREELRAALRDNAAALHRHFWGAENPAKSNAKELRWGDGGRRALVIAGPKRGLWTDRAGAGGDGLALIQHEQRGGFLDAVAWGENWLGWDSARPVASVDPVVVLQKAEEAHRKEEAAAIAWEATKATRITYARRLAGESVGIAGTLGETYLVQIRKIPRPAEGWPASVRFHASSRALLLIGTDASGTVFYVQRVFLTADGDKIAKPGIAKRVHGVMAGCAIRFPGDAARPLLFAEGPETALSVWLATGYETWCSSGAMGRLTPPPGRTIIVCADDDQPGKDADAALQKAIDGWRAAGANIAIATPWAEPRGDKSDLNNRLQAGGVEAVRVRIDRAIGQKPAPDAVPTTPPAPPVHRVSVKVGRAQTGVAIAGFFTAAAGWSSSDDPPPVHALKVTTGGGKSTILRRDLAIYGAGIRAKGDTRTAAILVPTLALADEQAAALKALPKVQDAGLSIGVYRGRDAPDPSAPGRTMCRDNAAVKTARDAGADVQTAVCRAAKPQPDGTFKECQFFAVCGYQKQRTTRPDITLGAHNLLFHEKPAAFGNLAALAIDEGFRDAGLKGKAAFPLDLFNTAPSDISDDPIASAHLRQCRSLIFQALTDHAAGPLSRVAMLATGLTADSCRKARAAEWRRKVAPAMTPGMSREAREQAGNAEAARNNRAIRQLAGFWKALENLLETGGPKHSGSLATGTNDDGARIVEIKGRSEIADGWQVPTLIMDATLSIEMVRPFYPQAELIADIHVATPHQKIVQVADRAFSLSMLRPHELGASPTDKQISEAQRVKNRLQDVRTFIIGQARRVSPGVALVVLQKSVEAALHALGPLPPNVETAHHNAIAGRDQWKDVALLICVGRTQPRPSAVEDIAEQLSGAAVQRIPGWYPKVTTMRETAAGWIPALVECHPDPFCEIVRQQICEAQIVQILGRIRGVNRTAANPVEVMMLANPILPVPVDQLTTWDAIKPTCADEMMAIGGVALTSPYHAARAFPGMWETADAAKHAFQREKSKLSGAERYGTKPYRESSIGKCPVPRTAWRYQLAGAGQKPAVALVDLSIVPNPAVWLTERLGRLSFCGALPVLPPDQPKPSLNLSDLPYAPLPDSEDDYGSAVQFDDLLPAPLPLPKPDASRLSVDLQRGLDPGAVYRGPVIDPPPADLFRIRIAPAPDGRAPANARVWLVSSAGMSADLIPPRMPPRAPVEPWMTASRWGGEVAR